ncbi:MAG: glycosyltransferase family 4 protein [Patescibacteria group bacterium]|jgi:glycosyltransferase involved in cell wall biosynthesis
MKIFSISLDKNLANKHSSVAKRVIEYGNIVDRYDIVNLSNNNDIFDLSDKVRVYSLNKDNKFFSFLNLYKKCLEILKFDKYNLITIQDVYFVGFLGFLLAKRFKIGLEIQVHGFEKYYGLRKIIAKYILPRTKAVRCVSQRLKKQLIKEFNVKEEKITVIPIFVDITNTPNFQRGIKAGNFIFLTVSRLVKIKNIRMQIEAMEEVIKKHPDIELWIIGDGPEKNNYELKIKNYKLEKNVKLLGWKDNLNEYYKQADAFLLTSNAEGWGMAVIEAASYGLPIIMTDVGCAGEVIKDDESGFVIPVGDKRKLVEAMIKIFKDENLRKKIGENAKLAVSHLPNKEQILELYKKSWQKAIL